MSSIMKYQSFQIWNQFNNYICFSKQNYSSLTYPGNHLFRTPDGDIKTILKPPGEVFGERIVLPFLKKMIKVTKDIDSLVSTFFKFIPVANAANSLMLECDSQCKPDDNANQCEHVDTSTQNLKPEIINLKKKFDHLNDKVNSLHSKTDKLASEVLERTSHLHETIYSLKNHIRSEYGNPPKPYLKPEITKLKKKIDDLDNETNEEVSALWRSIAILDDLTLTIDNLNHKIDHLYSKTNKLTWGIVAIVGSVVVFTAYSLSAKLYKRCQRS